MSRLIKPALDGVDKTLAGAGLTANALTLSGFFIGTLAATAIALHSYGISLTAIAASRVCDELDGALPVKPSPLTGAAETYALFAAMCIWLLHFAVLAYAFAVAWVVTTAIRVWRGCTILN